MLNEKYKLLKNKQNLDSQHELTKIGEKYKDYLDKVPFFIKKI